MASSEIKLRLIDRRTINIVRNGNSLEVPVLSLTPTCIIFFKARSILRQVMSTLITMSSVNIYKILMWSSKVQKCKFFSCIAVKSSDTSQSLIPSTGEGRTSELLYTLHPFHHMSQQLSYLNQQVNLEHTTDKHNLLHQKTAT